MAREGREGGNHVLGPLVRGVRTGLHKFVIFRRIRPNVDFSQNMRRSWCAWECNAFWVALKPFLVPSHPKAEEEDWKLGQVFWNSGNQGVAEFKTVLGLWEREVGTRGR